MKIAFFYLGQQGGGVALEAYEMAVGLSKRSPVLCVVSSKSDSYNIWVGEAKKNRNFSVIGIETSKSIVRALLASFNLWKFYRIKNRIDKFGPTVIYSHMGHPFEKLIIPHLKCKVIFKGVHDARLHLGEASLKARLINSLSSYRSTHYVVFSEFSKKILVERGVKPELIVTTFLGCLKTLNHPTIADEHTYYRILFFGRMIEYKGIGVLFSALEKVIEVIPNIKMVMAGRGNLSKYSEVISHYQNNLEIYNEWIKDDDIHNYFDDVDFIVAPYIDASQSGVVVLSYSYGKPVIVSNSGGLPEQVKERETGIVISPGDSKALSDAIIRMYADEKRLQEMKKQSLNYSKQLSWEAAANVLYDGLVEKIVR